MEQSFDITQTDLIEITSIPNSRALSEGGSQEGHSAQAFSLLENGLIGASKWPQNGHKKVTYCGIC